MVAFIFCKNLSRAAVSKTDQGSKYYPGIETYLEQVNNERSVNVKGLEDLIARVQVRTGLSLAESEAVVRTFFQEIRNLMLRGEVISLAELGKFFISSPSKSDNKLRVFPKFKLFKKIIRKINDSTT
jgi:nucleoid DNA-binding protein